MLRRLMLAVAATAALSAPAASAAAQYTESRIHALRSDSDNDTDLTSAYSLWYWAQYLGEIGNGPYATFAQSTKPTESISLVDDAPDLAWAKLIRRPAATSINSADDPSLPENAEFFNPPTLTDEHADAPPALDPWLPSLSTGTPDESSSATNAAVAPVTSPSLPGSDAWTGAAPGPADESTALPNDRAGGALAPIVEAPTLAVVTSPEPGTLALFSTGFVAIAMIAIKRRKTVA